MESIVNRMGYQKDLKHPQKAQQFTAGQFGTKYKVMGGIPKFKLLLTETKLREKYGKFGPNPLVYLGLLHRIALIMILSCLLVCIPLLIMNYNGDACTQSGICKKQNILYKLSILNLINSQTDLEIQAGIWLAVSVALTILFIPLRGQAVSAYNRIDDINTTQSDFSVILRRVPKQTTKQDIQKLINTDILHKIATKNNINSVQASKSLKIRKILMLPRMDKTIEKFHSEVKRFEKQISKKQEKNFQLQNIPNPTSFSRTCIVIFNETTAVNQIKLVTKRKLIEVIIEYIFPFMSPRTQFKIRDQNISIYQAPEPSAILWKNIGRTNTKRIVTKIIFTVYVILLLLASAITTYFVAYFQQNQRKGRNGLFYLNLTASLVVFVFNFFIEEILKLATKRQKIDTKANSLVETMHVIVIHQSINLAFSAIIVPIIMYYPLYFQGFISLDVPTTLIVLLISKVGIGLTLEFLYDYFEITMKVFKFLVKHEFIYRTQYRVNHVMKGVQLIFESKCAAVIQLMWFGFVFSVISPLCLPISAIGLVLICLYQRILFNSKYRIPRYSGIRFVHEFINLLRFVSLFIGISNLIVHQSMAILLNQPFDGVILSIIMTNIAVGGASCLIPWQKVFGCLNLGHKIKAKSFYGNQQFQQTYQQSNPLFSNKLVKYFEQFKSQSEKIEVKQTETICSKQTVSTPDDIPTQRPFSNYKS